jgi:chemotaxis protein histidine kinase CheA
MRKIQPLRIIEPIRIVGKEIDLNYVGRKVNLDKSIIDKLVSAVI